MNLFKNVLQLPAHIVLSTQMLKNVGISVELQKSYKKSGLLTNIGHGAYIKTGDNVDIEGGMYALLKNDTDVHFGGLGALSIYHKKAQYVRINEKSDIFSRTLKETCVPKWFRDFFKDQFNFYYSKFLDTDLGIENYETRDFSIQISSMERAYLELLYMCPEKVSIQEAYEILEMLPTLRPNLLQNLLEKCSSIKVKRLFMYLSSIANHDWYGELDLTKIHLGTSVYKISKNGKFNKEFNLVITEIR